MKINWKLRIMNKVTLVSLATLIVSIAYQLLNMFSVIPTIEQQAVLDVLCRIIDVLALIGIVVDPTTKGLKDSHLAMSYDEPKNDNAKEVKHED